MKKTKTITLTIILMLLSLATVTTAEADVTLSGNIHADVKEWLGVVYPQINLENQSVTFEVETITEDDETIYHVNDTLIINLDVTNESNRTFIFPRAIFYSVIMKRSLSNVKILPLRGLFKRIFPIFKPFGSENVIDSILGKNVTNTINLSIDYEIDEETYNNGEDLTLTIYAMGILPGDLNGVSEKIPFITKKQITLEVSYA